MQRQKAAGKAVKDLTKCMTKFRKARNVIPAMQPHPRQIRAGKAVKDFVKKLNG